ncbi:MAG: hypothetical protein JSS86_04440 [Cyanobacteria bacterium SZAS LIN-2]|nr:hypothetical protein [Cyanobacteria bacterium SZAS LIN-2]MBS2006927.1 hypothetical protein [Cyanobacteria bacterium SZAS TMP-1]
MQRLRRQFGALFVQALVKSPTLVSDLAELRAKGVKIRRVDNKLSNTFAESDPRKKIIYIGKNCPLSYQLTALAHEKYHVLTRVTPLPDPRKIRRGAFVNECFDCEVGATLHDLIVAAELQAAGLTMDSHTLNLLTVFQKGGKRALRKALSESTTSNTGDTYRQYYGNVWDEADEAI